MFYSYNNNTVSYFSKLQKKPLTMDQFVVKDHKRKPSFAIESNNNRQLIVKGTLIMVKTTMSKQHISNFIPHNPPTLLCHTSKPGLNQEVT